MPLLGRWKTAGEIDFDSLPASFVLKSNNGSGDVVICHDKAKLDLDAVRRHFSETLSANFGLVSAEPHYQEISPCIIAEELLDVERQDMPSSSLIDYKVWCFGGTPRFIFCVANRHDKYFSEVAMFDTDWNFHPEYQVWTHHYQKPAKLVPRPACLKTMLEAASALAAGLPQARIDMYVVDNKSHFGEVTLTSQSGMMDNYSSDFLKLAGSLTVLPARS